MAAGDVGGELLRIRDRLHKLEGSNAALRERLRQVEQQLREIGPQVDRIVKAAERQEAAAKQMEKVKGEVFTTTQKIGAALVGAVALADFVHGFVK